MREINSLITVRGVRSSWETLEIKVDFNLSARLSSSLANSSFDLFLLEILDESHLTDDTAQLGTHLINGKGFRDIIRGAKGNDIGVTVDSSMGRHADDMKIRKLSPDSLHQFEPIHLGHLDVGDQDGDRFLPQKVKSLLSIGSHQDGVTNVPDELGDNVPHRLFIIDH